MVRTVMDRLTDAVLRHKRLVAVGWILLTLVGMAAAGPASARRSTSASACPAARAGTRARRSCAVYGNGGETLPFVPVVEAARGQDRRLARRARASCSGSRRWRRRPCRGSRVAGFGSTGDRTFVSEDGRTAFVYVFPPRSDDPFGAQRRRRCATYRDALEDAKVGGRARAADRLRRAVRLLRRGRRGPGRAARGRDRRRRRAARARSSCSARALALVPLAMAICSILVSFLLLFGPHRDHRGLADRAVPGRADRARRVDRLRAAHRRALARGAREGPRGRRGGRRRDGAPPAARSSSRARRSPSACWR